MSNERSGGAGAGRIGPAVCMVMTVMALLAPSAPIGIGVVGRVVIQVSDGQDHLWADDGNDLLRQGITASRRGLLSVEQVERRNADGMATRQAKWGDRTTEKLALAKGMIDEASQRWPGLKVYLGFQAQTLEIFGIFADQWVSLT